LANLIGIRKRGENIGYVYNATTKEPISLCVIRIFNEDGKLIRTDVTNTFGVFTADITEGTYTITARKAYYTFPSEIVTGNEDAPIKNIYHGEEITLNNENISNISIPIDPTEQTANNSKTMLKENIQKAMTTVGYVFTILGFAYSIYATVVSPILFNYLIILGYLIIFAIEFFNRYYIRKLGKVTYNGESVEGATIYLYKGNTDMILDKRVSKKDGTYKFVIIPGKYSVKAVFDKKTGFITGIEHNGNRTTTFSKDIELNDTE
jgi:hypothetical protein